MGMKSGVGKASRNFAGVPAADACRRRGADADTSQ